MRARIQFLVLWIVPILFVSCSSYPEPESEWSKRVVSVKGMGVVQLPDNDDVESTYSGGVGAAVHLNRYLTLEGNFTPSLHTEASEDSEPNIPDWDTDMRQNILNTVAKVNLVADDRVRPYVGGGVNYMNYSGFELNGSGSVNDIEIEDTTGFTGVAGVVIDKKNRPWSLFGEAWYVSNNPDVDGRQQGGSTFTQEEFNMDSLFLIIGVSMHF